MKVGGTFIAGWQVVFCLFVAALYGAACSLDMTGKNACVTSADCLDRGTCINRTCTRVDAGGPLSDKDATLPDGSTGRVDARAPGDAQDSAPLRDGSSAPPDAGPSSKGNDAATGGGASDGSATHVDASASGKAEDAPTAGDASSVHGDVTASGSGKDAAAIGDASSTQLDANSRDGRLDAPTTTAPPAPGERANSTSSHGPAAYVRSDASNAVVFGDFSNNVQELLMPRGAPWHQGMLSGGSSGAPATAGPVSVFVQYDGSNTVTYRASDNHIWLLTLSKGSSTWTAQDLSVNATGCPPLVQRTLAAGPASGYVRSDKTSAVVFRGIDSHVYEISRLAGGRCWQIGDLNMVGGPAAVLDPMGFVRGDGYDSVVYASGGGNLYEFSLPLGQIGSIAWKNATIMSPPPDWSYPAPASGPPRGYVRSDGNTAVVYQSAGQIWEISRISGEDPSDPTWYAGTLVPDPLPAASDPMPYIRGDGASAVVYTDTSGNIDEMALANGSTSWTYETVYTAGITLQAVDGPTAYLQANHDSAIVFHDKSGDIWQLLRTASGQWTTLDLSMCAAIPSSCLNP